MAFLYVTEYKGVGIGVAAAAGAQVIQAPICPPNNEYRLAIGSTLVASTAFGPNTRLLHVHTDLACHVNVGPTPSTASNGGRLALGQDRFFTVTPGDKVGTIVTT